MLATVTLRDGRTLAYCEYGVKRNGESEKNAGDNLGEQRATEQHRGPGSGGTSVLWFPGTPSSRLFVPPDTRRLAERGVRLIVVERPGYGCSTPYPARTILDWPNDVAELADALHLDRFAVVGFSGGGPYAAACAYKLPARVRRLVVIGAMAPLDAPGVRSTLPMRGKLFLDLLGRHPRLASSILRWLRPSPAEVQRAMVRHLAPCDHEALAQEGVMERQIALTAEALRSGYDVWIHEVGLAVRPWGFDLDGVSVETTLLWGANDRSTSLAMAHAYARIPRARLRVVENAGHFVHLTNWDLVVDAMAE